MSNLRLSFALGDYDRVRPMMNGDVQIDGVDPVFMRLSPEEIFFRAFRNQEFDVCELSFSSYLLRLARGDSDYVAIPAFLSRAFRHTCIHVRKDRISKPEDLRGKRIGIPEYQLTAHVWARAFLKDDFGILPQDLTWVRGGLNDPGRPEKIKIALPDGVEMQQAPEGLTINALLEAGEIDAIMAPRAPHAFGQDPNIGWLFDDPVAASLDYYQRTKVFPIMHVVGIRKTLVEAHHWLPAAVFKAFCQSKAACLDALADTSATKTTLPFVEERLHQARRIMGPDFWSYGVAGNLPTLEAFTHHHHDQGLSPRKVGIEELFAPSVYETVRI